MSERLRWRMLATHVPAGGALGGMVRYVVELATALAARPDVELSVLAQPAAVPFFTDLLGDSRLVRTVPPVPTAARSLLERYTAISESAGAGGPVDVVHGTKHLLPRQAKAIRVLTVHDFLPLQRPADFGLVKRALFERPYLASIRDADVLPCVSGATHDLLDRFVPERRGRSTVVPLAMSTSLRTAVAEPVLSLVGRPFALVVGDPSPRKNIGFLVDLWDRVVEAVPDAVLVVAGPPSWAASEHGAAFDRLRAAGGVAPLGHVSDGVLRWCYEQASVALCPSLLEGFGLPAIEALAFGAPLITSLDPALCEVSGDRAVHLSVDDPTTWVTRIVGALRAGRPTSAPASDLVRTWEQVADETIRAVRDARHRMLNPR